MRRTVSLLIALALLFVVGAPAAHAQGDQQALTQALAWMQQQVQPDGSFPGFGPGDTADAVIGLRAAGERLAAYGEAGTNPITFLKDQAATYIAGGPGAAAKLALAAVAADEDPTSFGGVNLLQAIGAGYDPATGQYGPDLYGHALALLAHRAVGAEPPAAAIQRLLALQLEDGGWSFDGTAATGSDTNTTSLAIQALAGQDEGDAALVEAIGYLQDQQNDDGGFPYSQTSQYGNDSDANSTAAVVQALTAAGEDAAGDAWRPDGQGPLEALVSLQNPSGAFRYQDAQADDNALATYGALPALAGAAQPVRTTTVAGAAELLAPATGLPATGDPATAPAAALALVALGLLMAGLATRRAARA